MTDLDDILARLDAAIARLRQARDPRAADMASELVARALADLETVRARLAPPPEAA